MDEKKWKIYTRKGDKGFTSLIGGTRVPKNHIRVESYGTIDELKSFSASLFDTIAEGQEKNFLLTIIKDLFLIESHLAVAPNFKEKKYFPELSAALIISLEKEIDRMNEALPLLKSFILPLGHTSISSAHIARTVCRRAERYVLTLSESEEVNELILQYLNRLSDYFFVLARCLAKENGVGDVEWEYT